ncbi:MAG: hypothetical protein IPI66_02500 [Chitinophagaceae bacterium]|nr:hypothetical protein [Chitinophagaceae bacterium]MBL0055053.1 hypothetical protein [Chitinophagaceae bacterium]
MDNREQTEKKIEAALNSLDGMHKAEPAPFLMTRIQARMNRASESGWERTIRLVTHPAYVIIGLCLIVGVNALVVLNNDSATPESAYAAEQTTVNPDEMVSKVATLYDIENTDPQ